MGSTLGEDLVDESDCLGVFLVLVGFEFFGFSWVGFSADNLLLDLVLTVGLLVDLTPAVFVAFCWFAVDVFAADAFLVATLLEPVEETVHLVPAGGLASCFVAAIWAKERVLGF